MCVIRFLIFVFFFYLCYTRSHQFQPSKHIVSMDSMCIFVLHNCIYVLRPMCIYNYIRLIHVDITHLHTFIAVNLLYSRIAYHHCFRK